MPNLPAKLTVPVRVTVPLRILPTGPEPGEDLAPSIADMQEEPPVEWIAGGIMPNAGFSLIYGPGGTGKGMVAVALCDLLANEGYPPLVLDWERHPTEWRTRVLGMAARSADRIYYMRRDWLQSDMLYAKELVARAIEQKRARAVVIDSYFFAAQAGKGKSDPEREQAIGFAKIIIELGLPTLLLSHVTKREMDNPKTPYGSVFLMNAARAGWSIKRESVPGEPLEVRLAHRKVNEGMHQPDKIIAFSFTDGVPSGYRFKDANQTILAAILAVLKENDEALTWQEISRLVSRGYPDLAVNRDSVRVICYIYSKEGGRKEMLIAREETTFGTRFRAIR